jgi:hypothetical protein
MSRHIPILSRLVACAGCACHAGSAERNDAANHQRLRHFFKHETLHDNPPFIGEIAVKGECYQRN